MDGPAVQVRMLAMGQWIVGISAYKFSDYAFDYLLYPLVILKCGLIVGGVLMMGLSMIICLLLIRVYDRLQRDWLGIEYVKILRDYDGASGWRRHLGKLLAKSTPLAFLLLSLRYDPFITTAYLRHGQYGGLGARDWRIFLGSLVLGNAAWAVACFSGIELLEKVIG
jgi:hypothetical protein